MKLLHTFVAVGDEPQGIAISKSSFSRFRWQLAVTIRSRFWTSRNCTLSSTPLKHPSSSIEFPSGEVPRTLAISPDDRWLVTACVNASPAKSSFMMPIKAANKSVARKIFDGGFNPGVPAITGDSQLVIVPSAVNRAFSVTAGMIDIGWVIDNRLSKLPLPDGEPGDQKQLGLDIRGKAVGDANAVSLSPDEKFAVVTCGGTHELLVVEFPSIPWPKGDPGDFLPEVLRKDTSRFRRIKLGGRPGRCSVHRRTPGDCCKTISKMHCKSGSISIRIADHAGTVSLGGPSELRPDSPWRNGLLRRRSVAAFVVQLSHMPYRRSHLGPGLRYSKRSKLWHSQIDSFAARCCRNRSLDLAWVADRSEGCNAAIVERKHEHREADFPGRCGSVGRLSGDTEAHPENPQSKFSRALTCHTVGRQLFEGKAGCVKCHAGPTYTATETFDGAVEDPKDRNKQYNPPTLKGVSTRRRFLHTGKAKSLEQVITKYHRPGRSGQVNHVQTRKLQL